MPMVPVIPMFVVMCLAVSPVLPLSDAQQRQLATAGDHTLMFDEAALYPLLENAQTWPDSGSLLPGAIVPDYDTLVQDPATYRGQLCLIEGLFQRARPIERLARPIDGVVEYAIQVGGPGDPAAIVLLTHAPDRPPALGTRVRTSARFFKIWDDLGIDNQRTSYPVFVGHAIETVSATGRVNPDRSGDGGTHDGGNSGWWGGGGVGRGGVGGGGVGGGGWGGSSFWIVLVAAIGGYWLLRRRLSSMCRGPRPLPSRVHHHLHPTPPPHPPHTPTPHSTPSHPHPHDPPTPDDKPPTHLPSDPADAMAQLRRQHDESN